MLRRARVNSAIGAVRLVASAFVAVALLAGSASAGGHDPRLMVLRLGDVPTGFERKSPRYVNNAQAARETPGKNYTALGRITGYEVDFENVGTTINGVLQISSSASIYKAVRGAHNSMLIAEANAVRGNRQLKFARLSVGQNLGDEARLYTGKTKSGTFTIETYIVVWRSGRVFSAIETGALAGTSDPSDAVALAAKQQRHINGR